MLCDSIPRNAPPGFPRIPGKHSPCRTLHQNASGQMFSPENNRQTALLPACNLPPNEDQPETSRDPSDPCVGRSRQARRNKHFPLPAPPHPSIHPSNASYSDPQIRRPESLDFQHPVRPRFSLIQIMSIIRFR